MKNYTLVIVSGRCVVVRSYESISVELVHEATACTAIMTHTLVLHEENVVFEHHRGEKIYEENKEGYAIVKEILKAKKEIRGLTEREMLAIERAYR